MAIHARGAAGNVGVPGLLDIAMTISAVDPQLTRMGVVGESHRLNWLVTDPGVFRCQVVPCTGYGRTARQQSADYHHYRQPIGPLWEDR